MILVADQQYRAGAGAPGAAAAVNIEQYQYKAPPASAAVAAVAAAVITGIRCCNSSKYHTGTWYVQHNTDRCTVVRVRVRIQRTYSGMR